MIVDSYRFLPRSLRSRYDGLETPDGLVPWASFESRLADASICLLSSAGLSVTAEQPAFDLDGERERPTWGDPSHRVLAARPAPGSLTASHLHINTADIAADRNVALPSDVLADLVADGVIGASAPHHISIMGYQQEGLPAWREETAPALIELMMDQRTQGVVLAPV